MINRSIEDLATQVEQIGDLLDAQDGGTYRVRAYRNAADAIRDSDRWTLEEAPKSIDGVGDSIGDKIEEYWDTGHISALQELKEEFEFDPDELTQVEGIGVKTARTLNRELGICNLDDLEEAAQLGHIHHLEGFGRQTEKNMIHEIEMVRLGVNERIPIQEAQDIYETLSPRIDTIPGVVEVSPAGSLRREKETVGDVDILVATRDDWDVDVFGYVEEWDIVDDVIGSGETKCSFRIGTNQVDIRVVDESEFGAASQYFTGSVDHNVALRTRAKQLGYTLNEYGIFELENGSAGERIGGRTEEEMYEPLGLPVPDPTERTEEWVWKEVAK